MGGQTNNEVPLIVTKYLGSIRDGSNTNTNLKIGPFSLNDENDSLKVKILGLDNEANPTSFVLSNLRNTLIQLMEPSYSISDLAQATSVISSLSPGLLPRGCGGLTFMDELEFSFDFLRNLTSVNGKLAQEKMYIGTPSPPGCGAPSQYTIKLSIESHT